MRQQPQYAKVAIAYFQKHWATSDSMMVYEDCIRSCLSSPSPLPQWYLLLRDEAVVGGAGLITNDFISRMDLWPWLCALYVEESERGHAYGYLLIDHVKADAARLGFAHLYLCTDLAGYYERKGFAPLATGYHPWGESSAIYHVALGTK